MRFSSNITSFAKTTFILAAVAIGIVGFAFTSDLYHKASASAFGPTPSHTSAPMEGNCTSCHADFPVNSGEGNVTITGLPQNYLPGQQIPLTVTVSQSDGVTYGFQLTAVDRLGRRVGSYVLPPADPAEMQVLAGVVDGNVRDYLSHTINGITPTTFGSKSWNFVWTAPPVRGGKLDFYVAGNAANSDGSPGGDYIYISSSSTLSGSNISDFFGDGRGDIAVFRPSTGFWYALNNTGSDFKAAPFGSAGDRIVPGDYDGDGITDFAVWRPSNGTWYVQLSSGGFLIAPLGQIGDVPVQGDYDGDLKTDLAVWRPSTGVWYIYRSSDGAYDIRTFGAPTDLPVQGDFDGDAKTDVAVFRPSTGVWYIWRSSDLGFTIFPFGSAGDRPVSADFDGDGLHDAAVFRPSTGFWYILGSTDGFYGGPFGVGTDLPVPMDYDGDGKADVAVYRDGVWYILRSSDGTAAIVQFGAPTDKPVPQGYLPELPTS